MYTRDSARVFDVARWFPTHYQFHNEPLRLIASIANGMGFYGADAFVSATNAKQYQRRMRTQEAIASGKPAKVNPRTGRWTVLGEDDDADESMADPDETHLTASHIQPTPTRASLISEMFYGYLMLCASSYQPAMGRYPVLTQGICSGRWPCSPTTRSCAWCAVSHASVARPTARWTIGIIRLSRVFRF